MIRNTAGKLQTIQDNMKALHIAEVSKTNSIKAEWQFSIKLRPGTWN
jgi:hypothetical protein